MTVKNFEIFPRHLSKGHFRSDSTLFVKSILCFPAPITRVLLTRSVTEETSPISSSFRFPVAPEPVPVTLAAAPAPTPPTAVAVAPAQVAADTADVEEAEPQVPERPHTSTQDACYTNDEVLRSVELPIFFQKDSIDSSADTERKNLVYMSNFFTAKNSESPQVQSSSSNLPNSYILIQRLPPQDYHERAIQIEVPPELRGVPESEPAVPSNHLTQSQKRDIIIDLCQRTRNLQSSSDVHENR